MLRWLRVLAQDELRALGVKVGSDREVGIGEVMRRHLGEGPAVGDGLRLSDVEAAIPDRAWFIRRLAGNIKHERARCPFPYESPRRAGRPSAQFILNEPRAAVDAENEMGFFRREITVGVQVVAEGDLNGV